MSFDVAEARRRSAALFGNEKMVEVVMAMAAIEEPRAATAQQIAAATGIAHSLCRDVLQKLTNADVVRALPKVGGSRSAQYYQPVDEPWALVVAACRWVALETGFVLDAAGRASSVRGST